MKKVERKNNQKGFSLVELIIVIAILGIIAAIAVPNITGALNNAKINADLTNAKAIANSVILVETKATTDASTKSGFDDTAVAINATTHPLVVKEMNGTVPEPKLKGTEFFVQLNSDGTVQVFVDATGDANQVYPVPAVTTSNDWYK